MVSSKIEKYLKCDQNELTRLYNLFARPVGKKIPIVKSKINYTELAMRYQQLIDSGKVKNKAELARLLKVSRAWITKVMRKSVMNITVNN